MRIKTEYQQLKAIGLYAAKTVGNGNCLFNALSDQLYGDQSHSSDLRAITVKYIGDNPEHFKGFLAVNPGNGVRRNPKRKTAGSKSTPFVSVGPTAAEVEATFQNYLLTMAQGGTFGDNAEVIAFARAFKVDLMIFSEEAGVFYKVEHDQDSERAFRPLYILHHSWEHYSSIRNLAGPHTGIPCVKQAEPTEKTKQELKQDLAEGPMIQPWMVESCVRALPDTIPRLLIEKTLKSFHGNINLAVDKLLPSSSEGSSYSSSIERNVDSDDEQLNKPSKKQDRRNSRAHPLCNGVVKQSIAVRPKDSSLDSPDPLRLSAALSKLDDQEGLVPDENEEDHWQNLSTCKDSGSASVSTSASDYSTTGQTKSAGVRLKLSQPKRPENNVAALSSSPSSQSNAGGYEGDAEKPQRIIKKPRRRLLKGIEKEKFLAERAARNNQERLGPTHYVTPAKQQKENTTPVIDMGIKVLSI